MRPRPPRPRRTDRSNGGLHLDKAPDAFRTISEVADDLDIPQHVLRFWETRFAQIRPMKRGGGRRYYRPEDIALLRGIRELLYEQGFTISGARNRLDESSGRRKASGNGTFNAAALRQEIKSVLDILAR